MTGSGHTVNTKTATNYFNTLHFHHIIYASPSSRDQTPKQTGPFAGPGTGTLAIVPGGAAGRHYGHCGAWCRQYPQPGGGHRLFVHHEFAELPPHRNHLPRVQPAAQPAPGVYPAVAPGAVRGAGGVVVCGVVSFLKSSRG